MTNPMCFTSLKRSRDLFLPVAIAFLLISPGAAQRSPFVDFVTKRLTDEYGNKNAASSRLDPFCRIDKDPFAARVFFEYGAIFVATDDVKLPKTCIFRDGTEVAKFQSKLEIETVRIGNAEIRLQEEAMEKLLDAMQEANEAGLRITPLDGAVAGGRSYEDTVRVWNSRFYRALDHWVRRGKIAKDEADETRFAAVPVQVARVTEWERQGYFFSTGFSKSIFYSVAPPGTSQHLSLLAFDVVESGNPAVRRILNKNGWYQTIRSDQPHFTFLGVEESDLPKRGLRNIFVKGNSYWVPIAD